MSEPTNEQLAERLDKLANNAPFAAQREAVHLAASRLRSPGGLRELLGRVIEAAERALGDHEAPHDCYATGPMTGDPYADLVACPGCVQKNEIAAARAALASSGLGSGGGQKEGGSCTSERAATPQEGRPADVEPSAEDRAVELERLFDLRWAADQRAIRRWQAAGEGRELTWPDRADMVVWLLDVVDGLADRLDDLARADQARADEGCRQPGRAGGQRYGYSHAAQLIRAALSSEARPVSDGLGPRSETLPDPEPLPPSDLGEQAGMRERVARIINPIAFEPSNVPITSNARQFTRREALTKADDILSLLPAREGWKLVPVEPTEEMLAGACSAHKPGVPMQADPKHWAHHECRAFERRRKTWAAMLSAAPVSKP